MNGCREPEHEQAAGIGAAELARRVCWNGAGREADQEPGRRPQSGTRPLTANDLEGWLLGAGLAARTPSGLLIPTALGVELGGALGPR